jgi:NNP family nitrate/nitrite transporter-like MFS transporter
MWGGLLCGPVKGATEEDYYYAEYTPAERDAGHHLAASNFAFESRSMRGLKRLAADPMFPASGHKVEKSAANGTNGTVPSKP